MLKTLYLIILFLNLYQIFKSKSNKIIEIASIFVIYILLAGNTSSPDVQNYANMYSIAQYRPFSIEFGYQILEKIGNSFGLTYQQFRMALVLIPIALIIVASKKIAGDNIHLFLFSYLLYEIFMDSVQLRNFIAFSIVFFALQFLLNDTKHGVIKYLVFVLIASTFHITSIFFSIFVLVKLKRGKTTILILISASLLFCFLTYLNNNNLIFSNALSFLFSDDRIEGYLIGKTTNGFITSFAMQFLNFFYTFILMKYASKKIELKEFKYTRMIMWFNLLMMISFPIQMLNITFYRLFRCASLISVLSAQVCLNATVNWKYRCLIILSNIFFVMIWFWYDLAFLDNLIQKVWLTILEFNFFF